MTLSPIKESAEQQSEVTMTDQTIHVRPGRGVVDIDWSAVWRYRDLLRLLVYRDYSTRYKQTILGPVWYVVQPLLTTLIFMIIFGQVAQIPTDGIPPILFYLCGMLGWNYFSTALGGTSNVFQANMHLFGKVYFPRILVPLAGAISQLIGWAVQFVTFLAFFLYFLFIAADRGSLDPQWSMFLLVPLIIIQTGLIALGAGFWLSALTAKYRDLQQVQPFLLQAWMYLTPVVYPLSKVPEKWQWLAALNPMTMVVENLKIVFLGVGVARADFTVLSIVLTTVLFIGGLLKFQVTERSFVDSV